MKTNPNGVEYIYQTVALTDAAISQVSRYTGNNAEGVSSSNGLELESWSFTFSKIEVLDNDGKTTYVDDWSIAT